MRTVTETINGASVVTEIWMYRGDDEVIVVPLFSGSGESRTPYEMQSGDTVTLTVRETPSEESPVLLQITSAPGSNRIPIRHEDTAELAPGQYSADIQLLTADGMRKTVWPDFDPSGSNLYVGLNLKNFVIIPEVTTL